MTVRELTPSCFVWRNRPVIAALVFLPVVWSVACGGGQSPRTQPTVSASDLREEPVETIDGLDLTSLTSDERGLWIRLVNDLLSPCGEPISVARCAVTRSRCSSCGGAARYVLRLLTEGYTETDIRTLYRQRYDRASLVEVPAGNSPTRGLAVAKVVIVEFSDFECPHCAAAEPILKSVLQEYPQGARLVFKNFPLDGHPHALSAAKACVAAEMQGKFWEMHDLLFAHQTNLEEADLDRYGRSIGLDMTRFGIDRVAAATAQRVQGDRALGQRLGVEGTPTLFINGRRYREPLSSLSGYVREELGE